MKKIKAFLLSLLLLFSIVHTHNSVAMQPPDTPQGVFSKWKKKATWILASLVAQILIKEIFIPLIKKVYGNDFTERAKIRSLIKINQALKQQLEYIKRNCQNKALIKELEEKYLASCIRVMELQKQYLDTYEKKKQ